VLDPKQSGTTRRAIQSARALREEISHATVEGVPIELDLKKLREVVTGSFAE
jgi:hypothetical protein